MFCAKGALEVGCSCFKEDECLSLSQRICNFASYIRYKALITVIKPTAMKKLYAIILFAFVVTIANAQGTWKQKVDFGGGGRSNAVGL